eukprot:12267099-Alexandrium_andersonii.AAC.1
MRQRVLRLAPPCVRSTSCATLATLESLASPSRLSLAARNLVIASSAAPQDMQQPDLEKLRATFLVARKE